MSLLFGDKPLKRHYGRRRGSYDDVVLRWNALGEGADQGEQRQDGGQSDFDDDTKNAS
jgi:hypothetical protein